MADMLQVVCPSCDSINRVPQDKPLEKGRCGGCHKPLFNGLPLKLNFARFDHFLKNSHLPLLVDFWAPWCGPCKMMEPVFVQAARQLQPQVLLAKVNTEEEQQLAMRYGIMSIPTLVIFSHGREAARMSGAVDLQRLIGWTKSHV